MRSLDKKLVRDIGRLWAQSLAIAAVLATGVMIMVMSFGTQLSLVETRDTFYERNRFADVWSAARRAPLSLVPQIAAIDGVSRVEARISDYAILDIEGLVEPAMGQVLSLPTTTEPLLNVPLLRAGRMPAAGRVGEVMVNETFALANDFGLGDTFQVTLNGQKREVTIVGTALSPEFIYNIGPGALMPDDSRFGILWMAQDVLAAAFNLEGAFNSVSLKLTRGADLEDVKGALELVLKPYGGTGPYGRKEQISNAFLDGELKQLDVMARIVPPIFLVISAFLVNMVLGRLIALEREQIGLLKALGYSDLEVAWHYVKLAMGIGAIGVGLGWGFGLWSGRSMARVYQEFFHFPYLVFVQYPAIYAISALAGMTAAVVGAIGAVQRVVVLRPAVAMSPPAPTRFRKGLLDQVIRIFRPRQTTMMILRAIGRWPLRAALTSLGIATSASVMVASMFMFDAMDELMEVSFVQITRQDAVLAFALERPEIALEDVANLPGVLMAEGGWDLPVRLTHGPRTHTVAVTGLRKENTLSRVFDASSGALVRPEDGLVLSRRLAGHLDARIGDVVQVEFLQMGDQTHRVAVTGVVTQYFGLGAWMEADTLGRLLNRTPRITSANIEIDEAQVRALYEAVKSAPAISGITLLDQVRHSFDETIAENAGMTTTINSLLAAMIAIGVVYNSARIQLSERARELASLRILGFTRGEVSYILLGELAILTLVAIPLGLWIGTGLAAGIVAEFDSDLYSIPLVITRETYLRAVAVVAAAAVVSALIVRRRIDRMDLVAVMKTRE